MAAEMLTAAIEALSLLFEPARSRSPGPRCFHRSRHRRAAGPRRHRRARDAASLHLRDGPLQRLRAAPRHVGGDELVGLHTRRALRRARHRRCRRDHHRRPRDGEEGRGGTGARRRPRGLPARRPARRDRAGALHSDPAPDHAGDRHPGASRLHHLRAVHGSDPERPRAVEGADRRRHRAHARHGRRAAATPADLRWVFGSLYLWEGIPLVPAALGLFAIPELAELATTRLRIAHQGGVNVTISSQWEGVRDTLRNWWLVVRCGMLGTWLGAVPGIGSSVIDWIAYGYAHRTLKNTETFGTGDVRGVIAPESANNAKEGRRPHPDHRLRRSRRRRHCDPARRLPHARSAAGSGNARRRTWTSLT